MKTRQYLVTLTIPDHADDGSIEDGIYWREFLDSSIRADLKDCDTDKVPEGTKVDYAVKDYDPRSPFEKLSKSDQEVLIELRGSDIMDALERRAHIINELLTLDEPEINILLAEITAEALKDENEARKEEGDPEFRHYHPEGEDQSQGDIEGVDNERDQP